MDRLGNTRFELVNDVVLLPLVSHVESRVTADMKITSSTPLIRSIRSVRDTQTCRSREWSPESEGMG